MIAFRRALFGITDVFRSDRRVWILGTTVDDVRNAATALLLSMDTYTSSVVITGQELLEREASTSERLRLESVRLPM
jgi:Zn-dependent M16 (insulinase) family peptidase